MPILILIVTINKCYEIVQKTKQDVTIAFNRGCAKMVLCIAHKNMILIFGKY